MFRSTEKGAAADCRRSSRTWLGILCVLLISLPFGALTGLMATSGRFAGLPCLFCVPLSFFAYEKVTGEPGSQAGLWISAIIGTLVCLAGLCVSYVRYLYLADLEFGCTVEQAIGLLPSALWDPEKLPHAASNRLSVLAAAVLSMILCAWVRRLRRSASSS